MTSSTDMFGSICKGFSFVALSTLTVAEAIGLSLRLHKENGHCAPSKNGRLQESQAPPGCGGIHKSSASLSPSLDAEIDRQAAIV